MISRKYMNYRPSIRHKKIHDAIFSPFFDPLSCSDYHIISYPSLNQLSFSFKAQHYPNYIIHPLKPFKAVFNPVFFPSNFIPTFNPSNHFHLNPI